MKIVLIGANGTIGRAVATALAGRHQIVSVGKSHGAFQADLTSKESIRRLFETVGRVDAVVCAAGAAKFEPLTELTNEDFEFSIQNKLMGQVNLVRVGMEFVAERGSFTLTSGILAEKPMVGSAAVSLVNAAVEGFTRAAALELPREIRLNVVSPPWVSETLVAMGHDPSGGLPAAQVARAYVESVESQRTGEVLHVSRRRAPTTAVAI